jgi:hypothetical protein
MRIQLPGTNAQSLQVLDLCCGLWHQAAGDNEHTGAGTGWKIRNRTLGTGFPTRAAVPPPTLNCHKDAAIVRGGSDGCQGTLIHTFKKQVIVVSWHCAAIYCRNKAVPWAMMVYDLPA